MANPLLRRLFSVLVFLAAIMPTAYAEPQAIFGGLAITKETCTLYTSYSVDCWRLNDTAGGSIPIQIDSYGHLLVGNPFNSYTNLLGIEGQGDTLANNVGPALRVGGDVVLGDVEYFGATTADGLEWQQIGMRLRGAYLSPTAIGAGESGFSNDSTGSGHINLFPDVSNAGTSNNRGNVQISAHGSAGCANPGNEITLGTRSGVDTDAVRWRVACDGGFVAEGASGGSKGPGTINAAGVYLNGAKTVWLRASVSGGSVTIDGTNGVSSVTYDSAGIYTINFSEAFPSVNYAADCGIDVGTTARFCLFGSRATNSISVRFSNAGDTANVDPPHFSATFIGG